MATNNEAYNTDPAFQLDLACSDQTLARYRELYGSEQTDTPEPDAMGRGPGTVVQTKPPSGRDGRMDRFAYFFERCISIAFMICAGVVLLYTIVYAFAAAD